MKYFSLFWFQVFFGGGLGDLNAITTPPSPKSVDPYSEFSQSTESSM